MAHHEDLIPSLSWFDKLTMRTLWLTHEDLMAHHEDLILSLSKDAARVRYQL
jgi:hypothetical protein